MFPTYDRFKLEPLGIFCKGTTWEEQTTLEDVGHFASGFAENAGVLSWQFLSFQTFQTTTWFLQLLQLL